jgi:hypothetical protein
LINLAAILHGLAMLTDAVHELVADGPLAHFLRINGNFDGRHPLDALFSGRNVSQCAKTERRPVSASECLVERGDDDEIFAGELVQIVGAVHGEQALGENRFGKTFRGREAAIIAPMIGIILGAARFEGVHAVLDAEFGGQMLGNGAIGFDSWAI